MLLRLPTSMAILLNTIVKYHVATEPQRALPNSELRDVMLVAGSISTTGFGKRFTPGHFSLESRLLNVDQHTSRSRTQAKKQPHSGTNQLCDLSNYFISCLIFFMWLF